MKAVENNSLVLLKSIVRNVLVRYNDKSQGEFFKIYKNKTNTLENPAYM